MLNSILQWATFIAVAIYTIITWRILLNSNRQNNFTTLVKMMIDIKNDYDKIGLQNINITRKMEIGNEIFVIHNAYDKTTPIGSYFGYAAVENEIKHITNWQQLKGKINTATMQDFLYVVTQLNRLIMKLGILHSNDKKMITEMISDFYKQRIKLFNDKIYSISQKQPEDEKTHVEEFIALYRNMVALNR